MILGDTELVEYGRLFRLKLRHSAESRQAALDSIRRLPSGLWQVRIGGRLRGRTETYATKAWAERAVKAHYDRALFMFVTKGKDHDR